MVKSVLMRMGSKRTLAGDIIKLFPQHVTYIEPFFGTGSIFFAKPLAKYNFINDYDAEVFNFWLQVKTNKDALLEQIEQMPICEALLQHDFGGFDAITKAAVFFVKSNCTYLSSMKAIYTKKNNSKLLLMSRIHSNLDKLKDVVILNKDFRQFLKSISFVNREREKQSAFIYSDPPYYGTSDDVYSTPQWTRQDLEDCFEMTFYQGIRGAMSEFDHPEVLAMAEERGLNIFYVKNRRNLKNRMNEVLITNYRLDGKLFI